MSYVTWGVDGEQNASVYCHHCGDLFALNIPVANAKEAAENAKNKHFCTIPNPWRPSSKNTMEKS